MDSSGEAWRATALLRKPFSGIVSWRNAKVECHEWSSLPVLTVLRRILLDSQSAIDALVSLRLGWPYIRWERRSHLARPQGREVFVKILDYTGSGTAANLFNLWRVRAEG
jgi:hypothetical protein